MCQPKNKLAAARFVRYITLPLDSIEPRTDGPPKGYSESPAPLHYP